MHRSFSAIIGLRHFVLSTPHPSALCLQCLQRFGHSGLYFTVSTAPRGFIYSPDITSAFRFQCFPRFRRFIRNSHSALAFHLQSLQHSGLLHYSIYKRLRIVLQRLRAFRPFSICFQGFSLEFLRPSGTSDFHRTTGPKCASAFRS